MQDFEHNLSMKKITGSIPHIASQKIIGWNNLRGELLLDSASIKISNEIRFPEARLTF